MRNQWTAARSVLCFLMFLELFFWVGSWVTQASQSMGNALRANRQGVYRIMCIGESTTLAGGKESYPSQLEEILNRSHSGQVQVINQGMAGVGTTTIARELPQWVRSYKPDMVIAMIGINDPAQEKKASRMDLIRNVKIVEAFVLIKQKVGDVLRGHVDNIRKLCERSGSVVPVVNEYQGTMDAFGRMPDGLKKIYYLIQLAKGSGQGEIAELLYERFLQENKDPGLHGWVIKEYGALLLKMKKYEKFIGVMEKIPSDAWSLEWVKGYCHGEPNMERVKDVVQGMVEHGESPLIYGYVASCYEEGGRNDLRDMYLNKMGSAQSSYYSPQTKKNYLQIKDLLLAEEIQPVFVQYPMRDIKPLLSIFEHSADKEKIIFVDNGSIFRQAVREKSYEAYFTDRASGDHGHATLLGNRLLAAHIARAIAGKDR